MARKKERNVIQAPAGATAASGADDLQVMHPEQVLVIGERELTVREYGFVEGLKLRPRIQPLLDELRALMIDQRLGIDPILAVLGTHHALVVELMAIAADVDEDWINTLNQRDGKRLLMAWWNANGPFWLSEVVDRVATDRAMAARRQRAGATSTPTSSPPATEPSNN